MKTPAISRRTVLRGLGTAMALPLLDAMTPAASATGAKEVVAPRRMAFLYVPNGAYALLDAENRGDKFELTPCSDRWPSTART